MEGLAKVAFLSRQDTQEAGSRLDGPAAWNQVKSKYRQDFQQAAIRQETELAKGYQSKLQGLDPASPEYQQLRQEWEDARTSLLNQHHQGVQDPQAFLDDHSQQFPKQPIDPKAGLRPPEPRPLPSRVDMHPAPQFGEKLFPVLKRGGSALGLAAAGAGAGYLATRGFARNENDPNTGLQ